MKITMGIAVVSLESTKRRREKRPIEKLKAQVWASVEHAFHVVTNLFLSYDFVNFPNPCSDKTLIPAIDF